MDVIPLAVDHDLIKGFSHDLQEKLYDTVIEKIDLDELELLLGDGDGGDTEWRHHKLKDVRRTIVDLLDKDRGSDVIQSDDDSAGSGYESCTTSQ